MRCISAPLCPPVACLQRALLDRPGRPCLRGAAGRAPCQLRVVGAGRPTSTRYYGCDWDVDVSKTVS